MTYELRVYAGDSPDDPVVFSASDLQSQMATVVDELGPGVFAACLAALITASVAARMAVRHRAVGPPGRAPANPPKSA